LTLGFLNCYKALVEIENKRFLGNHPQSSLSHDDDKKQIRETIVNKAELIEAIAAAADISKASAERALDGATNAISGALKSGDQVTIVGFGSFYVGERGARTGRNPRTGETIQIAASKSPKFRAGKALKDAVN
jgi:DNA-binding protein HU-beta